MKNLIMKLLRGRILPVLFGPLKGMRLRFSELVKGRVFIQPYEPDKQKAFDLLISPGDVFFDIGSNVGLHSYYVSKKFSDVKIISFEPLPANSTYIKEMVALNRLNNISVVEAAVGSRSGVQYFDQSDNNSKGMLTSEKTTLQVKTFSLDDYCDRKNVFPDVIKIDVEGAESQVLVGAKLLIEKKHPIFVIELHNPEQDLAVGRILDEYGYTIFRLNPKMKKVSDGFLVKIKNLKGSWPDEDGIWGNVVAYHEKNFNLNPLTTTL